ncbi:hypothetical protein BDK51DRAFT_28941 [Blyttiomyces helicus]|uniref:Uncharacterized protein n=1 Tax=Blyttiomyces helicus TaxID=388810 RepID=A0A4P9WQ75_9FUNG|nr:hypothetical protein BDK51DRAFT_28941 [Blyttiomyces helicus]|eukprot:RKO94313.1 hypothetical protein BDK51DRAFT_28941 [Blyttiomyces helicus]
MTRSSSLCFFLVLLGTSGSLLWGLLSPQSLPKAAGFFPDLFWRKEAPRELSKAKVVDDADDDKDDVDSDLGSKGEPVSSKSAKRLPSELSPSEIRPTKTARFTFSSADGDPDSPLDKKRDVRNLDA